MNAAPAPDTALRTVVPIALPRLVPIPSAGGAVTLNLWLRLLA